MNMKYRSVLAVGMSVALMVQAPIVAFATDGSEQEVVDQGEQTPTTTATSTSAVVVDSRAIDISEPNKDPFVADADATNTYELNTNIKITEQGNLATQYDSGLYLDLNKSHETVIIDDKTISVPGDANAISVHCGNVKITNSEIKGDIQTVAGYGGSIVMENVVKEKGEEDNPLSVILDGKVKSMGYGGPIVINGSIYESQINDEHHDYVYAYEVIDDREQTSGNVPEFTNPNYIIKYANNDITEIKANTVNTMNLAYAKMGEAIEFTVKSGYEYSGSIVAQPLGGGRYRLVIPQGGRVNLEIREAIARAISEETSAPVVLVEESTPVEVPEEITSNEGIQIISTAAGSALPTTELGNAVAATKSVSLDITKVTPAQFRDAVKNTVQTVPAGGVAVIETNEAATLDKNMIAAMSSRPDVAYNIVFKFNGLKMRVVIPAGYDVKSLLDEKGYCGFLRLAQILGFTILE